MQKVKIVNRISVLICVFVNLAGCGATIQTIKVPVTVECREEVPDRPVMATEVMVEKPTLDQYTKAQRAEILVREGYEVRLRTALQACTAPIIPK